MAKCIYVPLVVNDLHMPERVWIAANEHGLLVLVTSGTDLTRFVCGAVGDGLMVNGCRFISSHRAARKALRV